MTVANLLSSDASFGSSACSFAATRARSERLASKLIHWRRDKNLRNRAVMMVVAGWKLESRGLKDPGRKLRAEAAVASRSRSELEDSGWASKDVTRVSGELSSNSSCKNPLCMSTAECQELQEGSGWSPAAREALAALVVARSCCGGMESGTAGTGVPELEAAAATKEVRSRTGTAAEVGAKVRSLTSG